MSARTHGWLRAGALAGAIVAADQATKALAGRLLERGEHVDVFFGIELANVRNRGVAFGLFAGGGPTVVIVITVVALAAMLAYFALAAGRPGLWLAAGLLAGGAAGNLADRARLDAVRDFIDLPFWPAFNLADVAITCGVLTLLYVMQTDTRPPDG